MSDSERRDSFYDGDEDVSYDDIGSERLSEIYDSERDTFYPQKQYDNWILNENTCQWESPIPYPNDGNDYEWNVTYQRWDLVVYKDPLLYKR